MGERPASSHKTRLHDYYYYNIYQWFYRNKSRLLQLNVISVAVLFLLHLFILIVQINSGSIAEKIIHTITIILICVMALSFSWRGIVSIAIGSLGILLIYAGVLLPSYTHGIMQESYLEGKNELNILNTKQPIIIASQGFFFLGLAMDVLTIIIAYRPDLLYVRNRPEPSDTIWDIYPIWYDMNNVKLIDRYSESYVHIKSLMTDQEIYLLWRYQYILTNVYGTQYLVKPDSYVPKSSTILRDKQSGKMIGKAEYVGFFV